MAEMSNMEKEEELVEGFCFLRLAAADTVMALAVAEDETPLTAAAERC